MGASTDPFSGLFIYPLHTVCRPRALTSTHHLGTEEEERRGPCTRAHTLQPTLVCQMATEHDWIHMPQSHDVVTLKATVLYYRATWSLCATLSLEVHDPKARDKRPRTVLQPSL